MANMTRGEAAALLATIVVADIDGHELERLGQAVEMARDALIEPHTSTDLHELMARQLNLMNLLGVPSQLPESPVLSHIMKDTLIMLSGEVAEALEPLTLASKPWKHAPLSTRLEDLRHETVDILFFLLEAFWQMGLTPEDVVRRYEEKRQSIIHDRMENAR